MCLSLQPVSCFSVSKKISLFLKQRGTGNPDLTKEENIVTDKLMFTAIFEYFNQIHAGFIL